MLGWPPAEAIGRDCKEFFATEETRKQFERDKARVLAGQGAVSHARVRAADDMIEATLSIGVTLAAADEGIDALLARADDAMYQAKEQGKNRVFTIPPPIPTAHR